MARQTPGPLVLVTRVAVSKMKTLSEITEVLAANHLQYLGGFHEDTNTVLMLGPAEADGFWTVFAAAPENADHLPDPLDRWSERVVSALALNLGAVPIFPFGGPPYHPFFTWATKTGRIHESPVKLLVHDEAGLWVSFRGALRFPYAIELPEPPEAPCLTCEDKPCLRACPIGALTGSGYDVPACKQYITSDAGADCMNLGCRVRAACPVSHSWGRQTAQSEFHMRAFDERQPSCPAPTTKLAGSSNRSEGVARLEVGTTGTAHF